MTEWPLAGRLKTNLRTLTLAHGHCYRARVDNGLTPRPHQPQSFWFLADVGFYE